MCVLRSGFEESNISAEGETIMTLRNLIGAIALTLLLLFCFSSSAQRAQAQEDNKPTQSSVKVKEDDTNLDTQLYLIVGTNQDVEEAKLPALLDPVIKQLRSTLPFKNYHLAATLINRVKTEGRLNLRWIGGPLLASAAATAHTPSFNEFNVRLVKVVDDAEGRKIIRMDGFNFGARIPIQTSTGPVASNGGSPSPVINYESTGLTTDISMREGEPVIVGTLNVGPSGDAIILVMSAKRTTK
jgi:hypothetical protein